MTTAVKAIYENGVFKPKEPLQLQERTEVEVLIPTQSPADDDPTGWSAARALIGFIDDAPPDMAEQHDHYSVQSPARVTFVDTGFLFALVSSKDEHHARVVEVFRTFENVKLREHLVTTNHVVAETITLTRKIGHDHATRLGDQLYGEKLASIHWTTPDEERAAFDYFKRHSDQVYSLVDCLSFVVMEKLGIREALAVDSDFTHRFVARPGPKCS